MVENYTKDIKESVYHGAVVTHVVYGMGQEVLF